MQKSNQTAIVWENTEIVIFVVIAETAVIFDEFCVGPEGFVEAFFVSFEEQEGIGGKLQVADFNVVCCKKELAVFFLE